MATRVVEVAGRLEREPAKTIVGQPRVIRKILSQFTPDLMPSDILART